MLDNRVIIREARLIECKSSLNATECRDVGRWSDKIRSRGLQNKMRS